MRSVSVSAENSDFGIAPCTSRIVSIALGAQRGIVLYTGRGQLSKPGVPVEKLFRVKIAKTKLRQDAL